MIFLLSLIISNQEIVLMRKLYSSERRKLLKTSDSAEKELITICSTLGFLIWKIGFFGSARIFHLFKLHLHKADPSGDDAAALLDSPWIKFIASMTCLFNLTAAWWSVFSRIPFFLKLKTKQIALTKLGPETVVWLFSSPAPMKINFPPKLNTQLRNKTKPNHNLRQYIWNKSVDGLWRGWQTFYFYLAKLQHKFNNRWTFLLISLVLCTETHVATKQSVSCHWQQVGNDKRVIRRQMRKLCWRLQVKNRKSHENMKFALQRLVTLASVDVNPHASVVSQIPRKFSFRLVYFAHVWISFQ